MPTRMSEPSVCLGCACVRKVALDRKWSPPTSAADHASAARFIVGNTMNRAAEAWSAAEVGGDHFRSSATFLTQAHPRQTEGSDILVGMSLDQVYAKESGQSTPIPSLQLCIEPIDMAGGCDYGYACA